MPTIGPEQYKFSAYIRYKDGDTSKPQLIAYWPTKATPTPDEVESLQKHAGDGDIEFTLVATRTVTENQSKKSTENYDFSVAGEGREAAISAINYLKQTHPGEFEEFAKACWKSAWGKFPQHFPQSWPRG